MPPLLPARTLEKLRRREQVTIVFLGDSNTALTFHTHGYLGIAGLVECALFLKYANTRSRVINAALCGEGVNGVLARLDADVISLKPDLVIVGYGMTSWQNGETHLQSTYIEPMRELVRRVRAVGAEVVLRTANPIICVNKPLPGPGEVAGREWPNPTLGIYARALVRLAAELECPVVDHYSLWLGQTYAPHDGVNSPNGLWLRMSDATHPNEFGHRAFYRELAPMLDLPTVMPWEV